MNLNKVFIIGRTTEKPELKQTNSGAEVSSFSMATNRVWTDKAGQKQEETEFHKIVVWGKTAATVCQWVEKGQIIMIEGRLVTRKWEDKQKMTHYSTEIVAERVQFGPKPGGAKTAKAEESEPIGATDDLPF